MSKLVVMATALAGSPGQHALKHRLLATAIATNSDNDYKLEAKSSLAPVMCLPALFLVCRNTSSKTKAM